MCIISDLFSLLKMLQSFNAPVQYRLIFLDYIYAQKLLRIYFPLMFTEHLLCANPSAKFSFSFKAS